MPRHPWDSATAGPTMFLESDTGGIISGILSVTHTRAVSSYGIKRQTLWPETTERPGRVGAAVMDRAVHLLGLDESACVSCFSFRSSSRLFCPVQSLR